MDYHGKNILAPMVRIGTLPTRLLALKYGADIVYSEEIIDHRFIQCKRVVNDRIGTIDFVQDDDSRPMFRTCQQEKSQVVFQLGTADAERALKAAKLVEKDVAAIDINMGCPKEYSIKGGMGAALLTHPDRITHILTTLVQGLDIPVTCKIRLLPTVEETVALARTIAATGVSALAVHGRRKEDRPRHPVDCDVIRAIARAVPRLPVIANGGSNDHITKYSDMDEFRRRTGATSVMVARAAETNCSVFRRAGLLPTDVVVRDYLAIAAQFDNHYINCKYCVLQMMKFEQETETGRRVRSAESLLEICEAFGMREYYDKMRARYDSTTTTTNDCVNPDDVTPTKRAKVDDDVITMDFKLQKCDYSLTHRSPKTILLEWTRCNSCKQPVYDTMNRASDRKFSSTVTVAGRKYKTTRWEKNKKLAEQSSAVVCLRSLGVHDGRRHSDVIDCAS